ncbi:hypothetical protein BD289DRAFT_430736 [Coniella lustricola]|uniref:Uncharacterized protein n=1 Tax=Coniella lustricola TaxID=2025994 RepID=A0A2T3ABK5_9PEZI|nr:hypothetical protein BD289DRAFT_430736 [Coniella lustricola]
MGSLLLKTGRLIVFCSSSRLTPYVTTPRINALNHLQSPPRPSTVRRTHILLRASAPTSTTYLANSTWAPYSDHDPRSRVIGLGISCRVIDRTFARQSNPYSNMASDQDYQSFLDKANQDTSSGSATVQTSQSKKEFKATDKKTDIPQPLVKVTQDAFYMSDADEPFVPVSLAWEKGEGLPNEEEIAQLVEHWDPSKAEVEILDPIDWDKNGQYKEIIDAVRQAGAGNDVRVYRIAKDGTRAEYFVVTRQGDGKDARLVGVKALAVES